MVQDIVYEHLHVPYAADLTLDVAIDALIQLKAPVDPNILPDLYTARPAQALIAASFGGDDTNSFLRAVVRTGKSYEWFAAANLLLARRGSDFAPDLLSSLRLRVRVYLVDSGMRGGAGGNAVGVGDGAGAQSPGMPPVAAYSLTSFAHPGVTILATGPTPTYYRRVVAPAGQVPPPQHTNTSGPSGDDRLVYLAAVADIDLKSLPLRGYEEHSLTVKDDSSLAAELARIRTDLLQRYRRLVATLVERGVLVADSAAALPPQIEVEIEDHRRPRDP
jgi:hypothetical protein